MEKKRDNSRVQIISGRNSLRRISPVVLFVPFLLFGTLFAEEIYRDKTAVPEMRARDAVARLTLDEKLTLTGGFEGMNFPAVKSLGLPPARMADASQGVRIQAPRKKKAGGNAIIEAGGVSGADKLVSVSFPGMLALAGTWDPGLAREFGEAMGEQCRALGVDILLGPGINMYRTSAGGRVFEYMGEDPYLTSRTAVAYVQGVQSKGVIATAKHFVANDTEFCRHFASSDVDTRTLREIYLPPWEAVIREAGIGAIMTGNHQVNGIPACMNKPLVQDILRKEWGFNGICMSDWHQTIYYTDKHDLVLPSGHTLYMAANALFRAWFEKECAAAAPARQAVMAAQLDEMVVSNLRALFASGFYDRGTTAPAVSPDFGKHKEVARRTAEGAICLLKNEGNILPLKAGQKILYIGEDEIHTGSGSGRVAGYDHVTYCDALKNVFGESIAFAAPEKVTARQFEDADVVLYNINKAGDEARDIPFELPAQQREQIERILSSHSNVVMLVTAGSGFDMPWIGKVKGMLWCYFLGQERGTALAEVISGRLSPSGKLPMTIEKQFSDSVAPAYNYIGGKPFWSGDTSYRSYWLTGEINEKTAKTIREQFIPNVKPREVLHVSYTEGIYMGYRWYDKQKIKPRFPFGHGLSYASFLYSKVAVKKSNDPHYPVEAVVTLKNTGPMTAKEVIQVYVSDLESRVEQVEKELAGYLKVELKSGETKTVTIPLNENGFKYFDVKTNQWILEPGTFEIRVGSSSQDIRLKTKITL